MASSQRPDRVKQRYWEKTFRESARGGVWTREFNPQGHLNVSQFYWWRRGLKQGRQRRTLRKNQGVPGGVPASMALVSDEPQRGRPEASWSWAKGSRLRIRGRLDRGPSRRYRKSIFCGSCDVNPAVSRPWCGLNWADCEKTK